MKRKILIGLLTLCLTALLCVPAWAGEVDCDGVYCFSEEDFSADPLQGICITDLPASVTGTVRLGSRILQPGDILTAEQVAQMTFCPLLTEQDRAAQVGYLPIYEDRVEKGHTVTVAIRGKDDQPPSAEDSAIETYKNIPNEGRLKAEDPEGKPLTFTVIRQPKRGQVELREDGSFLYTPKKNKVGVDSFVFTAADPAGNVSRQATVTVQILKPVDAKSYTDTVGQDCRFAAEWMRNTGLFIGEQVGDSRCFCPEKTVSKGQFLAMLTEALDLPLADTAAVAEDTPDWLKPYLSAALRCGLTRGLPEESRNMDDAVTGAEAAVMVQNALALTVSRETIETGLSWGADVPAWAEASLLAMEEGEIPVSCVGDLTRADVAQMLYRTCQAAPTAPGTSAFRRY